jgi:hypothetical protein
MPSGDLTAICACLAYVLPVCCAGLRFEGKTFGHIRRQLIEGVQTLSAQNSSAHSADSPVVALPQRGPPRRAFSVMGGPQQRSPLRMDVMSRSMMGGPSWLQAIPSHDGVEGDGELRGRDSLGPMSRSLQNEGSGLQRMSTDGLRRELGARERGRSASRRGGGRLGPGMTRKRDASDDVVAAYAQKLESSSSSGGVHGETMSPERGSHHDSFRQDVVDLCEEILEDHFTASPARRRARHLLQVVRGN